MPELPVIDDAHHAAATPLGPRIRSVGTAEFAGCNDRLDRERLNNLTAFIKAICWQIATPETLATGSVWAGLRPVAAEGCPYMGPTGTPGLWITSDHGHLGWTLAAGSVRLLADLMVGTKTEIASEP